jgi:branched-chain amino acid transport system substrate-binding protein
MERFKVPPSYNAEGAYVALHVYKKAVEKAGSTDGDAVVKALSGLVYDGPAGQFEIRAGDHQAVVGPTWGKIGKFDKANGVRMLDSVRNFSGKEVTPPVSETGCKL